MKKLIQEVHKQPHHIRAVFMWVSVVIVFSIIGFFSFGELTDDFARVVNPQGDGIAERESDEAPFALFRESFSSVGANLFGVFNDDDSSANESDATDIKNDSEPIPVRKLPIQ